jgi:hypothetical protein
MAIFNCCICQRWGEAEDLGVIISGRIWDAQIKKGGSVRLTLCAECWEKIVKNIRMIEGMQKGAQDDSDT